MNAAKIDVSGCLMAITFIFHETNESAIKMNCWLIVASLVARSAEFKCDDAVF